jgi:Tfp pilus assembly protein PilO
VKGAPNPKVFLMMSVATFALGSGLCYFQYGRLTTIQKQVEALRQEAREEPEVRKELEAIVLEVEDVDRKLAHLEKSIAEAEYIPTMMKELEEVGNAHGIAVTGVRPIVKQVAKENPSGRRAKQAYEERNLEVKGRGDYVSVMRFTKALQSFPKIVAVRSVSLSPKADPNAPANDTLEVVVELRAYVFPPKLRPDALRQTRLDAPSEVSTHAG